MTLLLDTHVLLWWLDGGARLSPAQARALNQADDSQQRVGVASVTLWEIARLAERRRIQLAEPVDVLLTDIEQHADLTMLSLTARIASESTQLGERAPSDPADQLIIATARVHGLQLVTADDRIRRSGTVAVV